jgi:hypothetical protein
VEALSSTRPVEGDPPTTQPTTQPTASPVVAPRAASVTPGYEVQYLLDAEPTAVDRLRGVLVGLGDSLVVVGTGDGDPPTWNVHVHVDDIGAAIEAGIVAGRPHRITVAALHAGAPTHHHPAGEAADAQVADAHPVTARLPDAQPADAQPADAQPADAQSAEAQSADIPAPTGAAAEPAAGPSVGPVLDVGGLQPPAGAGVDPRARAAVVVAAGDGLTALFVAEGATVVGRNPSTAEALDAIRSTGAGRVVLLPNDANTHAVAASAAREASAYGIRVSVVPTRSPVQALAALAVRDPGRAYSDDVIAMAEAAGACRYGEVCTASREALTVAGRCRPGDLLGLLDGEVSVIGDELAEVCRRLLDRMLGGGGELATLVLGADAPADLGATLEAHLAQVWPFVEVQCYGGGQPRYHLLVGVE